MEDIVISTDTINLLSIKESFNTVKIVDTEPVLITTDKGTVVTLSSESTVLLESPRTNILVTGVVGPSGADGINEEDMVYSKRVDFVGDTELYKAEAAVGSAESSPSWRIRKIALGTDGDVTETWASGNSLFDKVWTNRTNLIYS